MKIVSYMNYKDEGLNKWRLFMNKKVLLVIVLAIIIIAIILVFVFTNSDKDENINITNQIAIETIENHSRKSTSRRSFVITTNVDDQFYKAGFDKDKIFATQGSYRYIQCGIACHNKLYDAKDLVAKMLENTHDCEISSELVPVCPVCGETMDVNIRKDAYFVEDKHWYKQDERYGEFLDTTKNKNVLLLELGVGFNTPGIIRIPFEQMTYKNPNWKLVRINKDDCRTFLDIEDRSILIEDDISEIVEKIAG